MLTLVVVSKVGFLKTQANMAFQLNTLNFKVLPVCSMILKRSSFNLFLRLNIVLIRKASSGGFGTASWVFFWFESASCLRIPHYSARRKNLQIVKKYDC